MLLSPKACWAQEAFLKHRPYSGDRYGTSQVINEPNACPTSHEQPRWPVLFVPTSPPTPKPTRTMGKYLSWAQRR